MKIVLATGGSGGHLFPALKVAHQLKQSGHHIILIGSFGKGLDRIEKCGFEFYPLRAVGLSFSPGLIVRSVVLMLGSVMSSLRLLWDLRPDAVTGFGGYGAFPVVLAGVLLGFPTMIHEQNVRLGRANKILANLVRKVAVSFSASDRYIDSRKLIRTGCPCHGPSATVIKDHVYQEWGLKKDRLTILVFGGSQGSSSINRTFREIIPVLPGSIPPFQVVHAVGERELIGYKEFYADCECPAVVFEFIEGIERAYAIADLVISRAGALTVTELALHGKRAIVIPYPFAQGHQKDNAQALQDLGMAEMIEEKDLTPTNLVGAVKRQITLCKTTLPSGEHFAVPDADVRLARAIEGLVSCTQ